MFVGRGQGHLGRQEPLDHEAKQQAGRQLVGNCHEPGEDRGGLEVAPRCLLHPAVVPVEDVAGVG